MILMIASGRNFTSMPNNIMLLEKLFLLFNDSCAGYESVEPAVANFASFKVSISREAWIC